jgi:hypothetical protein
VQAPERFTLHLRIPGWSRHTRVDVNGEQQANITPGSYLPLDRIWQPGDRVEITLDMSLRLWVGEREAQGKVSLYTGPILLAYDPRFDMYSPMRLPALGTQKGSAVRPAPALPNTVTRSARPLLRLQCTTADGGKITLCDFASAGMGGTPYVSWLPAVGLKPTPFSRVNPLRAVYP